MARALATPLATFRRFLMRRRAKRQVVNRRATSVMVRPLIVESDIMATVVTTTLAILTSAVSSLEC